MALTAAPATGQQLGVTDPSAYVGNPYNAPQANIQAYQNGNGGANDPAFQSARYDNQQSKLTPWQNNAQQAAQTRSNYYYGGSPNGAADFNAQVGGVAQGLANDYGQSSDSANYYEGQNAAMVDQATALGGTFGQRANTVGALGDQAAGRNPAQFIDQQSLANNTTDRASQVGAIGGLNQFLANGPGPSAAQAQLNQATAANEQNSLALARSGRGMGQNAAAMRQAIGQNAVTGQQAANQSAVLRAQEAQNWQQNQLGAYGQIGNLSAAARQGDIGAASYLTGSQQAGSNANDQAGATYYGLQNQVGNQQLGAMSQQQQANSQGLAAVQTGLNAATANANTQGQLLGLQNTVNANQLQASGNYENNQQNYYATQVNAPKPNGTDYTPYIQAAATVAAAAV